MTSWAAVRHFRTSVRYQPVSSAWGTTSPEGLLLRTALEGGVGSWIRAERDLVEDPDTGEEAEIRVLAGEVGHCVGVDLSLSPPDWWNGASVNLSDPFYVLFEAGLVRVAVLELHEGAYSWLSQTPCLEDDFGSIDSYLDALRYVGFWARKRRRRKVPREEPRQFISSIWWWGDEVVLDVDAPQDEEGRSQTLNLAELLKGYRVELEPRPDAQMIQTLRHARAHWWAGGGEPPVDYILP